MCVCAYVCMPAGEEGGSCIIRGEVYYSYLKAVFEDCVYLFFYLLLDLWPQFHI